MRSARLNRRFGICQKTSASPPERNLRKREEPPRAFPPDDNSGAAVAERNRCSFAAADTIFSSPSLQFEHEFAIVDANLIYQ